MQLLKTYRGENFPKTYLVLPKEAVPELIVPFNILYLFGSIQLSKGSILPSHLPFSKGGQNKILDIIDADGFCFYKWPGRILGCELGDVLALPDD